MKNVYYNFLGNKVSKLIILFFLSLLISSCATSISKKTYVDAKLLPEDTAQEILSVELDMHDIKGFYMYPQMKFADPITYYFCDYQDPRFFSFNEIEVNMWFDAFNNNIILTTKDKYDEIGYPCSDPLNPRYKKYETILILKGDKKQENVINALVSLGVSINYE